MGKVGKKKIKYFKRRKLKRNKKKWKMKKLII